MEEQVHTKFWLESYFKLCLFICKTFQFWRLWCQHSLHFFWKHERLAIGLWRWSLFLLL